MSNPLAQPVAAVPSRHVRRLELQLALDAASAGRRLTAQALREAAESAGADLVFSLPGQKGEGVAAVLRLRQDGEQVLVQVVSTEIGYILSEGAEMDPALLALARSSVEVLERMSADKGVRSRLAAR
jgi:hypothetical protein